MKKCLYSAELALALSSFATATTTPATSPYDSVCADKLVTYEGVKFFKTNREGYGAVTIFDEYAVSVRDQLKPTRLQGLRVLDAGAGNRGAYVRFLRANGINAKGIDLEPDAQPFLIKADITETGLPAESFDVVFSTWSLFSYVSYGKFPQEKGLELFHKGLTEMARLIPVNGRIILAPLLYRYSEQELFGQHPNLHLETFVVNMYSSWEGRSAVLVKKY